MNGINIVKNLKIVVLLLCTEAYENNILSLNRIQGEIVWDINNLSIYIFIYIL